MEPPKPIFIKGDESLKRDQLRTLNTLLGRSRCDSDEARIKLHHKVGSAIAELGLNGKVNLEKIVDAVIKYIADDAPLVIHLPSNVINKVAADGYYRSVFEVNTRASNPIYTVNADGYLAPRRQWESECFLGLYDDLKSNFERPKYGALNFLNHINGAAPGYGRCYLTLKNSVRKRVTLATGDTSFSRTLGTLNYCNHVLAEFTMQEIIGIVLCAIGKSAEHIGYSQYREIQIHGELKLDRDFDAIYCDAANVDPAAELAKKYGLTINIID